MLRGAIVSPPCPATRASASVLATGDQDRITQVGSDYLILWGSLQGDSHAEVSETRQTGIKRLWRVGHMQEGHHGGGDSGVHHVYRAMCQVQLKLKLT